VRTEYLFILADDRLTETQVDAAKIPANYSHAFPIIIGETFKGCEEQVIPWDRFESLFGGAIFSTWPTEPEFSDNLLKLGNGELPKDLIGKTDDLFEEYVRIALEFIFGTRVARYGQERAFEAKADGIILQNPGFYALYDAKSYKNGFEINLTEIQKLKSYVDDFDARYRAILTRLNSFILISGTFPQRKSTLENKSKTLISMCNVPLSCLSAETLVGITEIISENPRIRKSVNWARVFSEPVVKLSMVKQEFNSIAKDGIIKGAG
jgi:hypothetical protein